MAIDLSTYGGALLEKGFPGGVADFQPATIISKRNVSATEIKAGTAVARSSTAGAAGDEECQPFLVDADKFLGFAIRSPLKTFRPDGTAPGYQQNDMLSIMQEGYMWAVAAEATARGDAVIAVTATDVLGSVTGGAAGAGRIKLPATWEETVTAGQIALIRIVQPTP